MRRVALHAPCRYPAAARKSEQELLSDDEAVWYPIHADDDPGSSAEPGWSGRGRAPLAHPALGLLLSPPAAWQRSTQGRAVSKHDSEQRMRKRKKTEPEALLMAIAETVDDGFCPVSSLVPRFPKLSHRDLVRLRGQPGRRRLDPRLVALAHHKPLVPARGASPLFAGRVLGRSADRLRLRRAPLAQVDGEDREGADGKELRLPVLQRRLPEFGAADVAEP